MFVRTYGNAAGFLHAMQEWLERDEVANSLMLGICLRLRQGPVAAPAPVYLASVEDERGPLLAAIMTPPYRAIVAGGERECAEALDAVARDLVAGDWRVPGVVGPVHTAAGFAAAWKRISSGPYTISQHQRLYVLRRVQHPRYSPGRLRAAAASEVPLLARWMGAFQEEVGEDTAPEAEEMVRRRVAAGELYVWDDGRPASMAGKTRPTAHGISVGPVYTPPELRGRGYATSSVASLSQALLDAGRSFCTLYTDLSNPTSNDIYQQVGYRPVCDSDRYDFHGGIR